MVAEISSTIRSFPLALGFSERATAVCTEPIDAAWTSRSVLAKAGCSDIQKHISILHATTTIVLLYA